MDKMLTRSVAFEVTRTDNETDGLTLEGYAAVFDSPTRISSWEGEFDETIQRGAFAKTISENTPVLQFDHGQHPMLGSIPLGTIKTLREDTRGLFVRARMSDNWLVAPVRDAIADGAITGMSFRFNVIHDEWDTTGDISSRTITELRCVELGPVVFPAYQDTEVGVRSAELRSLLTDDTVRNELARVLAFGDCETNDAIDDAAQPGTSDIAPVEPPPGTPRDTDIATIAVSHETVAQLIRTIDLTLKGVTR